jgi:putative tricarboxylic transport membrane protein
LQSSTFDLWVMLGFGVLGYVLRRFHYPLAPIVIGMILGPIAEAAYRRSLLISDSGHMIFLERPISATILVACVVLVAAFLPWKQMANRLHRAKSLQ